MIGFEQTAVTVFETVGSVELCAAILDGTLGRDVDVTLSTQPGTATGDTHTHTHTHRTLVHTSEEIYITRGVFNMEQLFYQSAELLRLKLFFFGK